MARATRNYGGDPQGLPEADQADGCPHPRHVYDLIGHRATETRLAAMLDQPHFHHAWLLTGPKGVGKATLAYRAIRRVLGGEPMSPGRLDVPENSPIASRIAALGHGDFTLIRPPWDEKRKRLRTEIPVDETRRLKDFFTRKPSEGGYRVCLIDSADQMNPNAANAILKTLEEPPEKTVIILISSEPGRLLPTIRSRCMAIDLRPVPEPEIADWLHARINDDVSQDHIRAAVKLAKGSPGRAFALAQNANSVLRPLERVIATTRSANLSLDHMTASALAAQSERQARTLFWEALIDLVQDQARYTVTGTWENAFTPFKLDKPTQSWLDLAGNLRGMKRAEDGLSMDKQTVMLNAFAALRAA